MAASPLKFFAFSSNPFVSFRGFPIGGLARGSRDAANVEKGLQNSPE
jgi:hypothetical protein